MPSRKLWFMILTLGMALMVSSVSAQDANLLRDPGFEGEAYQNFGTGEDGSFNVPADWRGWHTTARTRGPWENLVPNGAPHTASTKRSGNRSLSIGRGSATFTVAIYQQVSVPAGSNLRGSAWVFIENVSESASQVRVGIDPTGGTDPNSGGIIWSGWARTVQAWSVMTVDATAVGGTVTFFIYATQTWPNDPNNIFLDDASLTIGGPGGSVAAPAAGTTPGAGAPPPPPTTAPLIQAAFVSAQGAQDDGSIVHTVQPGDTIDAIAVAYGVTRSQILQLNNIANAALIQPGQKLLIKPADKPATPEQEPTRAVDETTGSQSVAAAPTNTPTTENAQALEQQPTQEPVIASTPTQAPTAPVISVASGKVIPPLDPSSTTARVCVYMFDDSSNPNRIQEASESLLAGGNITLKLGTESVGAYQTDGVSEPHCFTELAAGDYMAAASAPAGYGLTTPDQLRLRLQPGVSLDLAFGAAKGLQPVQPPPADTSDTVSPSITEETAENSNTNSLFRISGLIVLGLAGLVLVGGLGMILIFRRR